MFKSPIVAPLFLFIAVTFSSCANDDKITVADSPAELFNETFELSGNKLDIEDRNLINPTQILVVDSLLVVHDRIEEQGERYFYGVFNKRSGEFYKRFGREGRGPDEFLDNSRMYQVPNSDHVAINNRRLFSLSEISLERVLADSSRITVDQIDELNTSHSQVSKIDNHLLFGTGVFDDGRFALSDSSGELINTFLNYPFEEDFDEISTRDLGMVFQSNFNFHPTKPLVAVVNFMAGNLDILRIENERIEEIRQIYTHQPKFVNQSSETQISVMFDSDNRIGFWDSETTEEYIYALYSGQERSAPNSSTGNIVLVFDWDGNPVKQFNLDVHASGIAVDQSNETLYAITNDDNNEAYIATFSLD